MKRGLVQAHQLSAAANRFLCALALALLGGFAAAAEVPIPPLRAHVTDLTATLSRAQLETLETRLTDFEQRKGSQIVVLMLPSVLPETIEQYSIRLAEKWKIGRAGIGDGVILVIAKNDHTVQNSIRVEVGRGLEGAIPDAIGKRIGTDVIAPYFKKNDFYGGIAAGTEALMKVIDGEALPPPAPHNDGNVELDLQTVFWLVLAFLVVSPMLTRLFGRKIGSVVVGGIVGGIIWLVAGLLLYAIVGAIIAYAMSLVGGSAPFSRGGWSRGGWYGGGWGGGGFGTGGGGFGGGGGGFSGGGGDFGGGGASSNW